MRFNLPLIKEFDVDLELVSFLNKKYRDYILGNQILYDAEKRIYMSDTGVYTGNLLEWENEEYQDFVKGKLTDIVSEELNLSKDQFNHWFNHIFDYQGSGYVREHRHEQSEEFTLLFYLKTCTSGNTVFYLNTWDDERRERTAISFTPTAGKGIVFSGLVNHSVEDVTEGKRIFAAGVTTNAFKR
tara:strand:+ start:35 stop:589 length:555 start_codon:yes stop_codon:yes gene_type:complete